MPSKVCKDQCGLKFKSVSQYTTKEGYKLCRTCQKRIKWEGGRCPCCGQILATRLKWNKKKREEMVRS